VCILDVLVIHCNLWIAKWSIYDDTRQIVLSLSVCVTMCMSVYSILECERGCECVCERVCERVGNGM